MKFKKLVCSLLLGATVLGVVPNTEVMAEGIEFIETEDNNSYQTANEVTINTGTTVIKGDVTYADTDIFKKDEYDWYKITFAEQGKCDFSLFCTSRPEKTEYLNGNNFDVYTEDFKECTSYKYGLAHDSGDTYYIRVESNYAISGYNYQYEIKFNDDNSVEYVSANHNTTSSAYMLTEGDVAFSLGLDSYNPRYYAIEVPKGKKAEITIEPDVDADMNEVIKNPYRVSVIRHSDSSKLLDNWSVKKKETFSAVVDTSGNIKASFTGNDVYYIRIDGGVGFCNKQWYSIKYSLSDDKVDKKKPTIKGVKNGKVYKKAVTIKYSDESGIKSAKLNGKKISSGKKVTKKGSYTVTVTDKAGNKSTVRFKIK